MGRKTAACVLLFSYGLRDVPVDTHVGRVGGRLGLLRAGAGSEELHDEMLAITPPGAELELHINLIRHGRRDLPRPRPRLRGVRAAAPVPHRPRAPGRGAGRAVTRITDVTTWYLEMLEPSELRPSAPPRVEAQVVAGARSLPRVRPLPLHRRGRPVVLDRTAWAGA